MRGQAQVHIDAPLDTVFQLVSDVTRMGEWSPECRRCEWIGESRVPVAGARFQGHNALGDRPVILGPQYLADQSLLPTPASNLQLLANVDRFPQVFGQLELIQIVGGELNQPQPDFVHRGGGACALRAGEIGRLFCGFLAPAHPVDPSGP